MNCVTFRSNPTTQFLGAIAQHAAITEVLTAVTPGATNGDGYVDGGLMAGRSVRSRLKALQVISTEALAWEIWLWRNSNFNTGAIALCRPAGFWSFLANEAKQIAAPGHYYYRIEGLETWYFDEEGLGQVYVMLVNRSAAAKSADAAGALAIEFTFDTVSS